MPRQSKGNRGRPIARRPPPRLKEKEKSFFAPVKSFFQNVAIGMLFVVGIIVTFCLLILIAFHFALFLVVLTYALYVAAGLFILGILYVIVRVCTAISHRLSDASTSRAKAKMERERVRIVQEEVNQARNQVHLQQSKLAQQEYAFYRKYDDEYENEGYAPRRTRNFREESPYRTRVLSQQVQAYAQEPEEPEELEEPEPEETELEALGMPSKGQVFAFKNYKHYLKPGKGQLIIGIRQDGSPRIGSWQDFKIVLILGSSASGKSTTVLEKCVCIVESRGQLVICDPGGFKPDSLIQRMKPLQEAIMAGTSFAIEHEDIMQNVEVFRQELERRRRGASMNIPLLLVIDELNGLLMDKTIKKELTELIEKFAQQARGYNMYMILCAQRSSGLSTIRNSVISFICHKCPEMEAAKLLPARYAKLASQLGVGQTFVSDADGSIEPLQQTLITSKDIAASVAGRYHESQPRPSRQTEPMEPRVYGAPARRQAVEQQQRQKPQRTIPAQDPSPLRIPTRPTRPRPQPPQAPLPQTRSRSPIWGEDDQEQTGVPIEPPITGEFTQHLQDTQQMYQNAFDFLAAQRGRQQKNEK